MYFSFSIDEPRWVKIAKRWKKCITEGHDFEDVGTLKRSGGLFAYMLSDQHLYRCKHCGHYKERYKSIFSPDVHNKVVFNAPTVEQEE